MVSAAVESAPVRAQTTAEEETGPPGRRRWTGVVFSLLAYVLVALLANRNVWVHGFAHTLQTSGGQDTGEEVWFLAQTPWALIHGANPFANAWLNAPTGVNLMDNTTMPLLGVLGAPITLLFGPVATLNVMFLVGFAGSAMAFFLMSRRLVGWWPAAFVGGLLYGFSPYAVGAGNDHLFLMFQLFLPLVVLVVIHFFQSGFRSPWLHGLALGGCLVGQFYVSTEVFASLCVVGAISCVVGGCFLLWSRTTVDPRVLGRFAVAAALVAVLGIGYGAWVAVRGPEHINGPAQPAQALAGLSSDPLGLVVPTNSQHFTFGEANLGNSYVAERAPDWTTIGFDAVDENGSYVGIPLLIVLVAGILLLRRNRLAVFLALMAVVSMVLSMGSRLHVDGHLTVIRLPYIVLAHLPLLDSGAASRYVVFFWLFAGMLLVLILDRLHAAFGPARRGRAALATLAVAVVALLPLLPSWPYSAAALGVPAWVTTSGRTVPVGSTVMVYPPALATDSDAMLWQAMSDMRYRLPSGYAIFAGPGGVASFYPAPSVLLDALQECAAGATPTISAADVRAGLHTAKADLVVVVPQSAGAPCATELFDRTLGAHRVIGGVDVWRP